MSHTFCNGTKETYESYKKAQDAIKHIAVREKQGFRVYKCEECNGFHITSVPNKKIRPVKDYKYKPTVESYVNNFKITKRIEEEFKKLKKKRK